MPVLEPSGTAPPCACSSRAKSGLPSVRKRPSATSVSAPLGQRDVPDCITRVKWLSNLCYDWSSLAFPMLRFLRIKHLAVIDAVEVEFDAGPQRPDRRNRRRQVDPRRGRRPAARRPRVGRPRPDRRGRRDHRGDLRDRRRRAARPPRDHGAGPQPRVRQRRARDRRRAQGSRRRASIELHGQHEHQTLLDPVDASRRRSTRSAGSAADATRWRPRSTRWRAARDELDARCGARDRSRARARISSTFQLGELDRAALAARRGRRAARPRARCWPTPSASSGSASESYASLYESDDAVLAGLGGVWRRVARAGRARPAVSAVPRRARRRSSRSSRISRCFLRRYADGIDASPARLQQVEDRLALLERLKRKYGPTLADVIARRDALRRELADLERGDERVAELEREHGAARARLSRGGRERCRERGAGARRRSRAARGAARRAGDGADALRGPVRPSRCRRRPGRRAASTRPSSSSRRTPARTCGRWRASSRAASCRASCWRSRR